MPRRASATNSLAQRRPLKRGFLKLLIIACFALAFALNGARAQAQTTVIVPANVEWVDTGIDLHAGISEILSITAKGGWRNVAKGARVDASGYGSTRLPNAAAPTEPFGSLIGRVNGTIFGIGKSFNKSSPGSGRLFLSMNDVPGTYSDNSGQLEVVVKLSVSGAPSTFSDPVLLLELLSTDPIPFFERPSFRWVLKNRFKPSVSGELYVLLDGAPASADIPAVPSLGPNSELAGTFALYTGTPPHVSPGGHTVALELRAYTPDHAVVARAESSLTAIVPSPPPTISIADLKSKPDYQDQGKEVELTWTLHPTSTCIPADLVLKKKDYGEPEVVILQAPSPSATTPGAQKVVIKGTSSPLHYSLSVACKFCISCQTIAGTTANADVAVGFSPTPPAPTPNLVVYGAFFTPTDVHAKTQFSVSWTMENLGGAALDEFDVDLYLDGIKEGDSKTIPKLDAGKSSNAATWQITKDLAIGGHQVELKRKSNGGSLGFKPFDVKP